MKVKIITKKYVTPRGKKMVSLDVFSISDPTFTTKIFKSNEAFILREIEDGILEDSRDKYFFTEVEVKNEMEIEEMIQKILDLYRELFKGKKSWKGEKSYEFDI